MSAPKCLRTFSSSCTGRSTRDGRCLIDNYYEQTSTTQRVARIVSFVVLSPGTRAFHHEPVSLGRCQTQRGEFAEGNEGRSRGVARMRHGTGTALTDDQNGKMDLYLPACSFHLPCYHSKSLAGYSSSHRAAFGASATATTITTTIVT